MTLVVDAAAIGYAWEKLKVPLKKTAQVGLRKAWSNFEISRAQEKY